MINIHIPSTSQINIYPPLFHSPVAVCSWCPGVHNACARPAPSRCAAGWSRRPPRSPPRSLPRSRCRWWCVPRQRPRREAATAPREMSGVSKKDGGQAVLLRNFRRMRCGMNNDESSGRFMISNWDGLKISIGEWYWIWTRNIYEQYFWTIIMI